MALATEAQLTSAILRYIMASLSDGEYAKLETMGITPDIVDSLQGLSLEDVEMASHTRCTVFSIRFRQAELTELLASVQRQRDDRHIIDELIFNDAPLGMMAMLYGMDQAVYGWRRKSAGLQRPGRLVKVTMDDESHLWTSIQRLQLSSMRIYAFGGNHFLSLLRDSYVPLRIQWYLVQKWAESGLL